MITKHETKLYSILFYYENNFFRKIPILFLTGTLLFGVGCKDYDDDIDSISKRVDALEGEVTQLNSVAERFEAVEGVYTRLKDFQPADYVKDTELASELSAAKTAWMQEVSNRYLTKDGLQNALSALDFSFANAETVAAMKTALETYFAKPGADLTEDQKRQVEEYLAGILSAGQKTLGGAMSKYLEGYVTDTELSNYLKSADFEQELYDQLKDNQAKYKDAVEGYITAYIGSLTGDAKLVVSSELTAAQTAMDNKYDALKTTVDAIAVKVDDLIAAIQSLEFVPEYADGNGSMGYARIGEEVIYKEITMSYQVRPAAHAAKIAALKATGDVAFLVKEVKTTRAADAPALAIKNIEVTDADKGIFTVTATPADFAVVEGAETSYSIAFSIRKAAKENQADGIDRTTAYVNLVPMPEFTLKHAIRNTETRKIVYPTDDPAISKEIAFDDTETGVAPFGGYEAVYVTDDSSETPYTAAELAEKGYTAAAPEFKEVTGLAAFAADGTPIEDPEEIAKVFTLPANPGIDLIVRMASSASANKQATLTATYVFNYGETPVEIKTLLTVIGTEVRRQLADAELVWKYADATAYESGISIESVVDAGTELAPSIETLSALVADDTFTPEIVVYDGDQQVAASVTIAAKGSEGAAANTAVITLPGDMAWNKTYKVVATYVGANMNVILTADALKLTGMPTELALTVPAGNIVMAGKGNTVSQSVSVDALYNDNKAALEKHFVNIVEFSSFLATASSTSKNSTDAQEGDPAAARVLDNATALAFTFATDAVEAGKPQMAFIATVYDTDQVKAGQKILYDYAFEAVLGTQTLKAAVEYQLTLVLPALELNYDTTITTGDVKLKADYTGENQVYTLTAELKKYLTARIGTEAVLAGAFETAGLSLKFSKPAAGSASVIDEATGALVYKARADESYTAELCYHGIATGIKKTLTVKQPQQLFKTPTIKEYTLVRAAGGQTSVALNSDMLQLKNYENLEMIIDNKSDGSAIFGSVNEHAGKSAYAMYGATATPGTPTLKLENGDPVVGYAATFDRTNNYLLTITHSEEALGQPQIVEIPVTIKCPYQADMTATVKIKLMQSK